MNVCGQQVVIARAVKSNFEPAEFCQSNSCLPTLCPFYKMTDWIPATTLFSHILAAQNGQIVPGGGKHILIACMPKSASTYLCGIISALPEMSQMNLVAGHHRREQELCPLQCALGHHMNYVAAHHVRYSRATQDLLKSYKILPVVLVRNIFDCVVSLRDHLLRENSRYSAGLCSTQFP